MFYVLARWSTRRDPGRELKVDLPKLAGVMQRQNRDEEQPPQLVLKLAR
jgi:hypothetical protein